MKKVLSVICVVSLCAMLFGCGAEKKAGSSGYPIHEEMPNSGEISVMVDADYVIDDWYENISYEQFQEIESLFSNDQWQKSEEIRYDEYGASIIIYLVYPQQPRETIYLYEDDIVTLFIDTEEEGVPKSTTYRMPAGTCEKVNSYLQAYYQKQHDIVADLQTFFPDFFAAEYDIYWMMDNNNIYCDGSTEISDEILRVLEDVNQWEEISFDMDFLLGMNQPSPISFRCDNLYGDDFYIDFRLNDDGRTHISMNTYAAFLAPGEVYENVRNVLDAHEDQWEIIPVTE